MRAPMQMQLGKEKILRVIYPMHGIPKARLHKFKTYNDHHKQNLSMQSAALDSCLFYRSTNSGIDATTAIQVDDTASGENKDFSRDEIAGASQLETKGRMTSGES